MQQIVNKLADLERRTSLEKGNYQLFALFKNDNASLWTILVAAEWIALDKIFAYTYLTHQLRLILNEEELKSIGGFNILHEKDNMVKSFQQMFNVEHSVVEFKDCEFNGFKIKHAFIFTSSRKKYNPRAN